MVSRPPTVPARRPSLRRLARVCARSTPAAHLAIAAMPNPPSRPDWDIFCQVIDNFGDIGVCWRLARQLRSERQLRVRLWVDQLETFRALLPEVDPGLSIQDLHGVEIRRWESPFVSPAPRAGGTGDFRLPDSRDLRRSHGAADAAAGMDQPRLSERRSLGTGVSYAALTAPPPAAEQVFFLSGLHPRDRRSAARARPAGSPTAVHRRRRAAARFLAPRRAPRRRPSAACGSRCSPTRTRPSASCCHSGKLRDTPVCCLAPLSRPLTAIEAYAGQAAQGRRRGAPWCA
jgi:hypothetical protein